MSTQLVNICPPPPISPQDFYDALVGPEEKGVRQPLSGRGTLPFHPQVTFSWAALRLVGPLQSAAAPVSLVPEGPWFRPTPNPWRLKSVTVSLLCARFCTPAVNQPTTTLVVSLFFFRSCPWHIEVPWLGVELRAAAAGLGHGHARSEPRLQRTPHFMHHQILNPLSEAKDRTCVLLFASWVRYH